MRRATSSGDHVAAIEHLAERADLASAPFGLSTAGTVRRYEIIATTSESGSQRRVLHGHEAHAAPVLLDAVTEQPKELAVGVGGAEARPS